MPPNTCHDCFTLLSGDLSLDDGLLQNSILKDLSDAQTASQPAAGPVTDDVRDDVDYWDWNNDKPQSDDEKDAYWYTDSDATHDGMTVAKQEEVAVKRADAIARVEEQVRRHVSERERDIFFSGAKTEERLLEASRLRYMDVLEQESRKPNAGYWDSM